MQLKSKLYAQRVRAEDCGELRDKTVSIRRVAKVVKGGRRFGFSALVVSGDGRGAVGFGLGKAAEVPEAIRKASETARKGLVRIPLRGVTIPYEVIGKSGATQIVMKPGSPGTGVIAGSVARAIVEAIGVKDIRTKVVGSTNPHNVLRAVFNGLLAMKEPERLMQKRGIVFEEIGYNPY
jgi:small subunit ribosomal protein S5